MLSGIHLDEERALLIHNEVITAVKKWKELAKEKGASKFEIEHMEYCFNV